MKGSLLAECEAECRDAADARVLVLITIAADVAVFVGLCLLALCLGG